MLRFTCKIYQLLQQISLPIEYLYPFTKSRSSSPEVFCKTDVFKNFAKFTGKHLSQSLFLNKSQALFCEFCEIFKNIFFYTSLVTATEKCTGKILFLTLTLTVTNQSVWKISTGVKTSSLYFNWSICQYFFQMFNMYSKQQNGFEV